MVFEQLRLTLADQARLFCRRSWNVLPWQLPMCWRTCRSDLLQEALLRWITSNRDRVIEETVRTARRNWLDNALEQMAQGDTREISPSSAQSYEVLNIILYLNSADYQLCERLGVTHTLLSESPQQSIASIAHDYGDNTNDGDVVWRIRLRNNEHRPDSSIASRIARETQPRQESEQFVVRQTVQGQIIIMGEPRFVGHLPRRPDQHIGIGTSSPVHQFNVGVGTTAPMRQLRASFSLDPEDFRNLLTNRNNDTWIQNFNFEEEEVDEQREDVIDHNYATSSESPMHRTSRQVEWVDNRTGRRIAMGLDLPAIDRSMIESPSLMGETGPQGATGIAGTTGMVGMTGMMGTTGMMGFWTGMNLSATFETEDGLHWEEVRNENAVKEPEIPEKLKCEICRGAKIDKNGVPCKMCRGTGKKNIKMRWLNEEE